MRILSNIGILSNNYNLYLLSTTHIYTFGCYWIFLYCYNYCSRNVVPELVHNLDSFLASYQRGDIDAILSERSEEYIDYSDNESI